MSIRPWMMACQCAQRQDELGTLRDGIIRQIWTGEMIGIILAEAIAGILP